MKVTPVATLEQAASDLVADTSELLTRDVTLQQARQRARVEAAAWMHEMRAEEHQHMARFHDHDTDNTIIVVVK